MMGTVKPEMIQPKIYLVDDNITNLMAGRQLLKADYDVYPLTSAEALFEQLKKRLPDLILLDIEMPGTDGYETIQMLKADERYSNVPVIFLTVKNDENDEVRGLRLGAVDYISKPFSPAVLKKRVENHLLIVDQRKTIRQHADDLARLLHEKTLEIYFLQNAILWTVADLVEFRDTFTGGHISRTQSYMEVMLHEIIQDAAYSNYTYDWNMDFILPSCQLHDVGKIGISDSILNKPGKLTKAEYDIMKTHVAIGVDAISRMMAIAQNRSFFKHALNFVSAHHERWDGTGYPAGLAGENIPLEGRVMSIVDVYDAIISWRPYKKASTHKEAVKMIVAGSGSQFDPYLVDIFLRVDEKFQKITKKNKAEYI